MGTFEGKISMIIFDLDGTLADCEHRRHFVDPVKSNDSIYIPRVVNGDQEPGDWYKKQMSDNGVLTKWQPNWPAFYEACDKDAIILPVAFQFYAIREKFGICHPIQIWSCRCESIKEKTIDWLQMNFTRDINWAENLKMRPLGDKTPLHELKEKWLDEYAINKAKKGRQFGENIIDFVFDSDPKSIAMWKRRGIFVFNCSQD